MTVRQISGGYDTVVEVLRAGAQANADVEAFVEPAAPGAGGQDPSSGLVPTGPDGRRRLTFAAWDAAADRVAALLAAEGVRRGDVVALLVPSSIDYAVTYQAAARLGAVTTGINLRLGAAEQASITSRARPAVTVVDAAAVPDHAVPPHAGRIVERRALGAGPDRAPTLPVPEAGDLVAIVWTSGSTGVPKGALFDHRCLAAVAAGTDVLSHPGDRRLSPLPFAHVGYMTRPWDEIAHVVTTVIAPQPWTAGEAIALMAQERVTVGQGVPTQWALVLGHPDFAAADLSALRIAGTGAARVPPELVRAMRQRLGCPVVVRYTSTESSLGTSTDPGDPDEVVATTVGRPVPGVELMVCEDDGDSDGDRPGSDDGATARPVPVAAGEVGRVRLRSRAAMRGYLGDRGAGQLVDRVATAAALDDEGWITTGDLGYLGQDGNLRLVGRVSEMYIRGGYNVYPAEVEATLGAYPGVSAVAVVGAPDPVLGEVGVAFVVPAPGADPTLAELRGWCATHLADYKAPDRLRTVDELPVTPMGKVDKRALAELAASADSTRDPTTTKVGT